MKILQKAHVQSANEEISQKAHLQSANGLFEMSQIFRSISAQHFHRFRQARNVLTSHVGARGPASFIKTVRLTFVVVGVGCVVAVSGVVSSPGPATHI